MKSQKLASLPTIRDVLQLAELRDALPEVVTGQPRLDSHVRWVHVLESTNVEKLLQGHELVLTTAVTWPSADRELQALARSFARAQTSAIVLELGTRFASVPEAFVEACRSLSLPLIVLHAQVKFVVVTEKVHQQIISAHNAALQAQQEVSRDFAEMIARGADTEHIMEYTSTALSSPVVLQDPAGQTVDLFGVAKDAAGIVDHVARHPEQWHRAKIMANAQLWGYLLVPELSPASHPAGNEFLVHQAALALAVGRLASPGRNTWRALRDRRIISSLASGNYARGDDYQKFLAALGLDIQSTGAYGLAMEIPGSDKVNRPEHIAEHLEVAGIHCAVAHIRPEESRPVSGAQYVVSYCSKLTNL